MADIPGGSEDKREAGKGRIVPLSLPSPILSEAERRYTGVAECDLRSPKPIGTGRGRGRGKLPTRYSSPYFPIFPLNPETQETEPTPAEGDSDDDFPPYDPRDYEDPREEWREELESVRVKKDMEAAALSKSDLGRGRGRGYIRPVTPTPPPTPSPRSQSPSWDEEELAAGISCSPQIEPDYDDREYAMASQATDFDSSLDNGDQPLPGTSRKEEAARDDNESAGAGALPKPGLERGRSRGKKQSSPPSTPMPTSSSVREPAAEAVSPQPGPSQPESQYVPGRHPFYDKGYEIEEPVVARFGRSELLETFAQHDRRFEGPLKVTTGFISIKEANEMLRKGRAETRKNKAWRLIPVADMKDEEDDSD